MGKLLGRLVVWFRGKKTILGGGLVIAAGALGVWFGKVDPATGLALVGMGLSAAGYGAKANRHQAELVAVIQGISQAGVDVRAGHSSQAAADLEVTGEKVGPTLLASLKPAKPGGDAK